MSNTTNTETVAKRRGRLQARQALARLRTVQDEMLALKRQIAQVQARQEAQERVTQFTAPALKVSERNTRLLALLDAFEQGDAAQQQADLAALQAGIEEARPGQRRVFDEGTNS